MKPFDIQDTAMILIDHQVGTNTWAMSTPLELLQRNVFLFSGRDVLKIFVVIISIANTPK